MIYNEILERGSSSFPIELYHLDKNHPRYEMAAHLHSEIEIIRIVSGKINVKLNLNEYMAETGDIFFVNPETVHSAVPVDDCVYECIVLNAEILNTADPDCRFFIDSLLSHEIAVNEFNRSVHDRFFPAVKFLFDSMQKTSSGYKFSVISALYNLFGAIIENNMYISAPLGGELPRNQNLPKLKKALSYIRENYDKQITLAGIAEKTNMSEKYFCTFFKNMTRKTPMEYLIFYRIECAARKLINSDMSITDIAFSCGFNDLSYFIKTFRRIKGITPKKFRK